MSEFSLFYNYTMKQTWAVTWLLKPVSLISLQEDEPLRKIVTLHLQEISFWTTRIYTWGEKCNTFVNLRVSALYTPVSELEPHCLQCVVLSLTPPPSWPLALTPFVWAAQGPNQRCWRDCAAKTKGSEIMSVCRADNANVWIKIFIFPQADHFLWSLIWMLSHSSCSVMKNSTWITKAHSEGEIPLKSLMKA